ncbi:MAG: AMP-binding protein [Saprospiraceae bacterium]|nr:AMP-binding protein [Lewinella sp.]
MSDIAQIFQKIEQKTVQSRIFAQLEKAYTYAELTDTVQRIGGVFSANGLQCGDRIVISSKDHFALGSLVLAGLRYGITVILMDPDLGPIRAHDLITLCTPKGYFVDHPLISKWSLDQTDGFCFSWVKETRKKGMLFKKMLGSRGNAAEEGERSFSESLKDYDKAPYPAEIDPQTIAYILFTSGTTSTPKAVQISHWALWANLDTISRVYELDQDSRIFNILTTYHTDGVIQGPVLAALNAAGWYHPMDFSVDQIPRIFDDVYKYRVTHFITVPTMLSFLLRFSEGYEDSFLGEDFKYIVTSAAPFEVKLWEDFEATFQTMVVNNYGLTETIAGASYCGPQAETRKVGTIGKPVDCEFRIIDENGAELGANEAGELLIKGDNLLTNYLNNEEATRQALQNGWFHTGDIAQKDDEGFYTLIGRKKNIVISGGINIQPEEVSEIINTHPEVIESVCFGVPDPIFGENLHACVVKTPASGLDGVQIIEHCRSQLEPAKLPKQVFFLPQLPKTISGKIKAREVREQLKESTSDESTGNSSHLETIVAVAAATFNVPREQINIDSTAENLNGWDSLAHLLFVTQLEEQFNIRLSSKEIMVMSSIREAEKIVSGKVK